MLCVGLVDVGSVQTSNWCLAAESMTAEDPLFSWVDAVLMIGRMKGASSDSTNSVTRSVMVSISFSRPGILETMAEILRTTLSRKT